MKKWLFIAIAILFIAFNGCKKDDTQGGITATKMKLEDRLSNLNVPVVMRNSTNEYAVQAVGNVNQIKNLSTDFVYFDMPDNATKSGNDYFWSYGGYSIWETYSESGNTHNWEIDMDMGAGRNKYMKSQESSDGSSGFLQIFDVSQPNSNYVYGYNWTFDSKGDANLIWSDYAGTFKSEVQSNTDFSGYSKWYSNGKLLYEFIWNADGSGNYSLYGDDGTVALAQTWKVSDL